MGNKIGNKIQQCFRLLYQKRAGVYFLFTFFTLLPWKLSIISANSCFHLLLFSLGVFLCAELIVFIFKEKNVSSERNESNVGKKALKAMKAVQTSEQRKQ